MVTVRTRVGAEIHLHCRQATIFFRAQFDGDFRDVTRGVSNKLFFTGVAEKYRTPGHAGCPGAHFFQQDVLFGTKTAANSLFNDMNFMLFHAHEARDLAA